MNDCTHQQTKTPLIGLYWCLFAGCSIYSFSTTKLKSAKEKSNKKQQNDNINYLCIFAIMMTMSRTKTSSFPHWQPFHSILALLFGFTLNLEHSFVLHRTSHTISITESLLSITWAPTRFRYYLIILQSNTLNVTTVYSIQLDRNCSLNSSNM